MRLGAFFEPGHRGERAARARCVDNARRLSVAAQIRSIASTSASSSHAADVMRIQIVELLEIEAGRALADILEIEPFDGLLGGNDLVIAVAPAQPQQVVAHGLGQIAHVAIGLDGQRAMAL